MKRRYLIITVFLLVHVVAFPCACQEKKRRPSRYLIPEGYVGWVRITFLKTGAPPLPIEDNYYLFKFPTSGLLATSSDMEYGVASDQYFYYCGDTRRPLHETAWGGGGMIHAGYNGWSGDSYAERTDVHEGFFVGTEEQLRTVGAERDDRSQPKAGPVDKSKLTCVAP
jgi:hypothetical protein